MRKLSTLSALIVEDDGRNIELLTAALRSQGVAKIYSHANALRALTQLIGAQEPVDLILCDLAMPHMDGVEFFRRLAEIGYQGGVVVVSGETERLVEMVRTLARAHKLNLLGCLAKPVDDGELKSVIDRWLAHVPVPARAKGAPLSPEEIQAGMANQEFINFYQPKVDLASGALVGVEALLRWRRGTDIIAPDRFITVAERHGLIDDLTRYVVHQAFAQARGWQDGGVKLSVSINVSMENMDYLDFPEFIVAAAAAAGIAPSTIMLEVTESRLMREPTAVFEVLMRLRLKGFRLSIDDFGTGYSSLAQLRDIAFDELKVDLGFIHGAWNDPRRRAIVEASVNMARQLGMVAVAEGVADRADWDFIRTVCCGLGQGYFIAKPMPGEDLIAWIEQWRCRVEALLAGRAERNS